MLTIVDDCGNIDVQPGLPLSNSTMFAFTGMLLLARKVQAHHKQLALLQCSRQQDDDDTMHDAQNFCCKGRYPTQLSSHQTIVSVFRLQTCRPAPRLAMVQFTGLQVSPCLEPVA